jgi:ribosomal protein S18 acetylase RimI-like enzyme
MPKSHKVEKAILRRLRVEDVPALVGFYNGLSTASKRTFRPIEAQTSPEVCATIATENHRPTPTKFDLIAVLDDVVIGWSFIWELLSDEPIFGLAVADAYQGRGLGTALITRVLSWARAQPLSSLFLTVVRDNDVAKHLYEKQGFVKYDEFAGNDGLSYDSMRLDLHAPEGRGGKQR